MAACNEPFYGVVPGKATYPIGRVCLLVTFSTKENFRTKYQRSRSRTSASPTMPFLVDLCWPYSWPYLWRWRFLISIIDANARISWVKPADIGQTMVNLGHHLENLAKQSLMTLLIMSTHTWGQPLVKGMVKIHLNPNVFERPPELLPCSPNFTYRFQNLPI
jgi:hypothetical protein